MSDPRGAGAAVRVVGDDFKEAVAHQLARDGFVVTDDDPRVVVACRRSVTRATLGELAGDRRAAAPLVVVIDELPTPHLIRALTLRLDGIVALDRLDAALRPTVEAVLAGQSCYPLSFRERLERPLLSAREKQVLAMVVLGLANLEIAHKLFVTEASVKAHLTSAFIKLGVRSREAAAALILDPDAGYGPGILRITPEEDEPAQPAQR